MSIHPNSQSLTMADLNLQSLNRAKSNTMNGFPASLDCPQRRHRGSGAENQFVRPMTGLESTYSVAPGFLCVDPTGAADSDTAGAGTSRTAGGARRQAACLGSRNTIVYCFSTGDLHASAQENLYSTSLATMFLPDAPLLSLLSQHRQEGTSWVV